MRYYSSRTDTTTDVVNTTIKPVPAFIDNTIDQFVLWRIEIIVHMM